MEDNSYISNKLLLLIWLYCQVSKRIKPLEVNIANREESGREKNRTKKH